MAINNKAVGSQAMAFMERLEEKYGAEACLGPFGFIAVVDRGDGSTTTEMQFATEDGPSVAAHEIIGMTTQIRDRARGII